MIFLILFMFGSALKSDTTIVYELGGITVTAKRLEVNPSLFIEMNSNEFEAKGLKTVGEALDYIPLIYSRTGRKGEDDVKIMGIEQREVAVMVDNHSVRCPYDGTIDLSQIPLSNISKIEVLTPPLFPMVGPNSLGGAVNVVTKKTAKNAVFGLKNYGSFSSRIDYGEKIEDIYCQFSGGFDKSSGYNLPDGSIRENSDYYSRNISGKLGWEPHSGTEIGLSLARYWNEKGIPVGLDGPRYWRFTDWNWWYSALHFKTRLASPINLRGNCFFDAHDNTLVSYTNSTYSEEEWESIYDNHSYGGNFSLDIIPFSIMLRGDFKEDLANLSRSDEPTEEYRGKVGSLSAMKELNLTQINFNIQGGLGYEFFDSPDSYIDCIDFSIGGVYFLNYDNSLYFSVGRGNRFPTLKELFSTTSGNPNLKTESSMSYQVGLKVSMGRVGIFYHDIKNLIEREDRYSQWENLRAAYLKGVYLTGKIQSITLSYVFLDASDGSGIALDDRPKHTVKINFDSHPISNIGLNLGFRYRSEMSEGDDYLDSYLLVDFGLRKEFEVGAISMGCSNLFNTYYEEEIGYPLAGRSLYGRLLINLAGK